MVYTVAGSGTWKCPTRRAALRGHAVRAFNFQSQFSSFCICSYCFARSINFKVFFFHQVIRRLYIIEQDQVLRIFSLAPLIYLKNNVFHSWLLPSSSSPSENTQPFQQTNASSLLHFYFRNRPQIISSCNRSWPFQTFACLNIMALQLPQCQYHARYDLYGRSLTPATNTMKCQVATFSRCQNLTIGQTCDCCTQLNSATW